LIYASCCFFGAALIYASRQFASYQPIERYPIKLMSQGDIERPACPDSGQFKDLTEAKMARLVFDSWDLLHSHLTKKPHNLLGEQAARGCCCCCCSLCVLAALACAAAFTLRLC
jgi:hypothetical protein